MISIIRATEADHPAIVSIGKVSVTEAHKDSCAAEILGQYIDRNYNNEAIKAELANPDNIYFLIQYNGQPVGFSKIVLNAGHPAIDRPNVTKLDRIYLLREFQKTGLGIQLLNFNCDFAKEHKQSGIWLYTWEGNERAITFYLKAGFSIIGSHNFYVTETHYNPNHHMLLSFTGTGSR